jgi:hypothetical protein
MMPTIDSAFVFQTSSTLAMLAWLCLILAPRWPRLLAALRYGVIGALSLVYSVLIALYFFRVPGGGFNSIEQVRALFASDPVLTAGWIHYLAFDLWVGFWIAAKADLIGLSRILQAPILLLTFMFGPAGWLSFVACRGAIAWEQRLRVRWS